MNSNSFDVIVVGGGHAGYEAALAAARIGSKTLLITLNPSLIGRLPCNPSIGGIAKSHIVSEIDALGGELGRNADYTGIQYRMLNTRKGPAVQSNRLQCDKDVFPIRIQKVIEIQERLSILDDMAIGIATSGGVLTGVDTSSNGFVSGKSLILATGTFLRGRVLIGMKSINQGRMGEDSAEELSSSLKRFDFELGRLKTGTPPRLHGDSIDYSKMEIQPGDDPPPFFSRTARADYLFHVEQMKRGIIAKDTSAGEMFHVEHPDLRPWMPGSEQIPCYLTHTNEKTHQIIADNLKKSAMYGGMVEGTGVRYCPSIEDKIVKFSERNAHHVFVEPEGRESVRIYPNGTSNSLPEDIQGKMIHSIKGFEKAEIIRPGYAIEYDFVIPTQLFHTLETKRVENLYFAGQINGTTGYEEAAGQGFVAGVNAALKVQGRDPFILGRDESYIGVMIDDLVTKGTDEPYRMFTSRSEHRLTLRQDNVYSRLFDKAQILGVLEDKTLQEIDYEIRSIKLEVKRLEKTYKDGGSLVQWLRRPEKRYTDICPASPLSDHIIRQVEIEVKYSGYIKREAERIEAARNHESIRIPSEMDYGQIKSLRYEACEKLKSVRPTTLGQASRIPGVNPSDVSILRLWMKKHS